MREESFSGYATVYTTKTKTYFCYETQFSLFTFHVYENLLEGLKW